MKLLSKAVRVVITTDVTLSVTVNEKSVNQVLFRNNSDTEDALALDDEDLGFLEDDLDQLDSNANNDDGPVEVYIEPPQRHDPEKTSFSGQQSNCKEVEELPFQDAPTSTSTPLSFDWKKVTNSSYNQQQQLQHESSIVFDFGKVTTELKNETPYEVFNKVAGLEDFLKDIVVPQTHLYCEQEARVLSTNVAEMKAFFWNANSYGLSSTSKLA